LLARDEFHLVSSVIHLYRPADPDDLLDDPSVHERHEESGAMPYWAYLWPSAQSLARVVHDLPFEPNTPVLELGCGLGLPGLVALAQGARVHLTDREPLALRFAELSALASGLSLDRLRVSTLDWANPDKDSDLYSLILAADVLYERPLVPLVVDLINQKLAPGGRALLADPVRPSADDFPDLLKNLGLDCFTPCLDLLGEPAPSYPIRLFQVLRNS
jgi:predicted nicotinamide N-methyase